MADISSITLPGGGTYDLKDKNAVPKYGMGKNLLDNPDFANPVNQRGQSSYTGANTYGISRWKTTPSSGSKVEVSTGAVTVSETGSSYGGMLQIVSKKPLLGKTVTLSILYKRKSGDVFNFSLRQGAANNIGSALSTVTAMPGDVDTLNLASVTVTVPSTITASNYVFFAIHAPNTSASTDIIAAKLELGTEQTLAHLEGSTWILNEIPDYEYELYRCITSTADPDDIYANKVISTNVSKPNLLDNAYFVGGGTGRGIFPVNQQGNTSYSGAIQYTINRWRTSNSNTTISLTASGLVTSASGTSVAYLLQRLNYPNELLGKKVTLSILTSAGLFTKTATLPSSTPSSNVTYASIANIGQIICISSVWYVRLTSAEGSGNTYYAAKLELGTEQTLSHQEGSTWVLNEIPDYEEELIKCQTSTADSSDTYANKSLATRQDLTSIQATGTTNTTGAAIPAGAYFYLNGILYQAKTQIAVNATFTVNTNCEQVTSGGLNSVLIYAPGESYSFVGIFAGISNSSGTLVSTTIQVPKYIPTNATITKNITIGWARGQGTVISASVSNLTRASSNCLVLDLAVSGVLALRSYYVYISGTITFG